MVHHERETATEDLKAAEAELAGLRVTLALARKGEEAERRRFERESIKAAALREDLAASETRRKAQEDEISLVRKQVQMLFGVFCDRFGARKQVVWVLLRAIRRARHATTTLGGMADNRIVNSLPTTAPSEFPYVRLAHLGCVGRFFLPRAWGELTD